MTVYEPGSPQSRGYAQVYVTVNRDDGLPLFNPTQYNARIDETADPNTAVVTLILTDPTGVSIWRSTPWNIFLPTIRKIKLKLIYGVC